MDIMYSEWAYDIGDDGYVIYSIDDSENNFGIVDTEEIAQHICDVLDTPHG